MARVGEGCQLERRQRTRGGVGPDGKLVRDCVCVCVCVCVRARAQVSVSAKGSMRWARSSQQSVCGQWRACTLEHVYVSVSARV